MAEGKKGIIVYADWITTFEELTDEEAGQLIKHFFRYVNDHDPEPQNRLIKIAFEPIKQQLKRDLKHWEEIRESRSRNGKMGGRPKKESEQKQTEAKKANGFLEKQNKAKKAVIVNDNVNVNVNDNVIEYKKALLSEIKISDFPNINPDYLEITKSFQLLIRSNLIEAGASTKDIDKTRGAAIDQIRLMIESDGYTIEDMRKVYLYLQKNSFWKKNILSINKLREKMTTLKMQMKNENGRTNNQERDWNELAEILHKHVNSL
jgi:hypothetical protein